MTASRAYSVTTLAQRAGGSRPAAYRHLPIDMAVLAAVATVLAWQTFTWPLASLDESVLLVWADQVNEGMVPHRDFFTVYGPADFYTLAGLFTAFGSSLSVERALGLVFHLAIAIGCYGIGRTRDRLTAVMAGVLSLILLARLGTVAYAWLGAMACLVTALALAERRSRSCAVWAGLLAGLGASFRPELLVVILPVLAPYLWRDRRWRSVATGLALGITPLAVFCAYAGARMWQNIGPGRAGVDGSLRLLDNLGGSAVIVAAVLGLTFVLVRFAWKCRSRASLAHAILALGILPQTLQRVDAEHALYTLCVTAPLAMIGAAAASRSSEWASRRRVLSVAVGVALLAGVGTMVLRPAPETVEVQFGDRSAWIDKSEVGDLLATRSALLEHAPAGGSIFVGATDMSRDSLTPVLVYHLVPELRARAYYLDLTGGAAARSGSGLVDDLRRSNVLLLTRLPDGLMERISPYAQAGSQQANQVVAREFCLVGETRWGEIYQRMPCAGPGMNLPAKVGVASPSTAERKAQG